MQERWAPDATAGRAAIDSSSMAVHERGSGQSKRLGSRTSISPDSECDAMTVRSLPWARDSQRARSRACSGRRVRSTTGTRPSAVARTSVDSTACTAAWVAMPPRYARLHRPVVAFRCARMPIDAIEPASIGDGITRRRSPREFPRSCGSCPACPRHVTSARSRRHRSGSTRDSKRTAPRSVCRRRDSRHA